MLIIGCSINLTTSVCKNSQSEVINRTAKTLCETVRVSYFTDTCDVTGEKVVVMDCVVSTSGTCVFNYSFSQLSLRVVHTSIVCLITMGSYCVL